MYLLFDIGATKMRLGISSNGETIDKTEIVPTPGNFDKAMKLFSEIFTRISSGLEIKITAGGIRGVLNKTKDKLDRDALLTDWVKKPLGQKISEIVGSNVYLENDTAMVGMGEAVYGAGRGYKIVAYITVSSGVGGVRIVNKRIDASAFGFEPGHQLIDADVSLCPNCTSNLDNKPKGSLEGYVSGRSLERRLGKKPQEVTDKEVWDELAEFLAYGVNNTIVYWSPDIVILGGGMLGTPGISVEKVKEHVGYILKIFPEIPEIKKAELGDIGGLHGALVYLKQLAD